MSALRLVEEHIQVMEQIKSDENLLLSVQTIIDEIINTYNNSGRVFLCGNGGSAADAQHIAAELTGRFKYDRRPLSAEALHTNTAYVTAISNDYGYDNIYSRLLEGIAGKNDILIGLTTSGSSVNVVNAFKVAKQIGVKTVALVGDNSNSIQAFSDLIIKVPSKDTARIQEAHMLIGHIICEYVEEALFGENN